MKKVLFVATVVKTHIMEFHIPYLKMFRELGWETAVAAKNDYENPEECVIPYCDTYYNIPFERFPLKPQNMKAYKILKKIIDDGDYEIVHCHTPVGAMLTRLAAIEARRRGTKVYYTAHGFHFYKGAPLINWLLYYPVEKWLSRYTDVLITINKEDYKRAEKFKAKKNCYIPGVGIDLKKFDPGYVDRAIKRKEIGVKEDDFVLLSVDGLISRKNYECVLKALSILKKEKKLENLNYVICGKGIAEKDIVELAKKLNIESNVNILGYRYDIAEIYSCCDLFVCMSEQEDVPVALMEAMACGIPVICTNLRSNMELIDNEITGFISEDSSEKLAKIINKAREDNGLCEKIALEAKNKIKHFDLSSIEKQILDIYSEGGATQIIAETLQGILSGQKIRSELEIPINSKVILSVGEINKNKNHKIGIEALTNINDDQTYYVICGRGPLMDTNKKIAKELGIEDRVIFAGYRMDVYNFYKMADLFLFPSFREGLPVAVMEAMASGLPVIATKIRGNLDLISGEDVKLLNPMDVVGFSEEIKKYLQVSLAMKVGVENQSKSKEFEIKHIMQRYKEIYFE